MFFGGHVACIEAENSLKLFQGKLMNIVLDVAQGVLGNLASDWKFIVGESLLPDMWSEGLRAGFTIMQLAKIYLLLNAMYSVLYSIIMCHTLHYHISPFCIIHDDLPC